MTETEYQDLVNRVLSTLRTNSKEIENLPSVLQLSDTDSFEISKGRKVSFSTLLKHIKGYQSSEGTEDNSSNMDILQIWKELSNDSNLKLVAYDYMPDRVKSAIEWVEIIKSNDNDNAINKWNEIISFLSEVEATSLNEILKTYATKEQLESLAKSVGAINGDYIKSARKISAGTGLTGGGDLSVDRTLSLATIGKSGTYTKVIVDAYGRVTGSSTLLESDIPYLSIAKISNLQSTIDTINKKFAYYLPLSGGAMTSTKLVTSLNADLLDGVHLKDVHKSGWVHVTPYSHDTTVVKYYWFKVAQIDYAQDKAGKAVLELLAMGDNNYPYSNSAQLRIQNYCDIDDDGNLISHTSSIMLITDVHNEVHLKATIDRNGGVWVQADSCGIYSTLSWRAILEGESDYPNVQIHNGTTKQFDTPEGTIIHENEGVRYDVLNNTYISYPYNYQIGGSLTIGGANGVTLSWDTENQMLRISKGGYFLGPVSTKGVSAETGTGGTGINISRMWEELASDDATKLINLSHMPSSVKTAVNWVSSVTSSDADSQINKWNEIVDFLNGVSDTSSLNSILSGKANASVVEELSDDVSALSTHITNILARKVNAGTGLTGGGTLNDDVTLSLATIGKSGTYTKVIVDAYGRVTGSSTLLESDIPYLSIAKISNLQSTIDAINGKFLNYLSLSGGKMANTNLVTNLNADLLDGYNADDLFKGRLKINRQISVSAEGWYTIASITTNGFNERGTIHFAIRTTGGDFRPYVTHYYINSSWAAGESNIFTNGIGGFITGIRLTQTGNSNAGGTRNIELCFSRDFTGYLIVLYSAYDNDGIINDNFTWNIGALPIADTSAEVWKTLDLYHGINTDKQIRTTNALYADSVVIGGVTLSWDYTNGMLKLDKGAYFLGPVSTKGVSNETGTGGTGVALSAVWDSLANNTDAHSSTKIHLDHIPTLTKSKISDFPTLVSAFANDAGYITASAIINKADKATTLAGYGITDAVPFLNMVNASNLKSIGMGYVNANGANGENGGIISFGFASYQTQIHSDYSGGNIHWRVNSNGTLTNWKNLLDSHNYSNYAVTLNTNQTISGVKTLSANLLSATRGTLDIGDGYNSFNRIFVWHYKSNSLTKSILSSGKWYRIWNFSKDIAGTHQKNAIISINKAYIYEQGQTITLAVSINNWGQTYVVNQLSGTTGLITKVRVTGKRDYSYVDVYISSAANAESYSVSGYGNGERVDFEELADDATNDSTRTEELTVVNGTAVNYPLSLQNATPLVVNSTTMVANLNANYLGGLNKNSFQKAVYDYINVSGTADTTALPTVLAPCNYNGTSVIGAGNFNFYDTKFFNGQSNTSNRCQLAYGYDHDTIAFRRFSGGEWKSWKTVAFTDVDSLTPNSGQLSIIGAMQVKSAFRVLGEVDLSSMVRTNSTTGVLDLDGNYIDVYAPMNVKTSLNIGQATISWDSVNGMLKVNTGAYFLGPVSTKGVSNGSGLVAVAQFGVTWQDSWYIEGGTTINAYGTTTKSISEDQGSVNGSEISITCNAFAGKKVGDIEIFTLGWDGEPSADARLVPFAIYGSTLICTLRLNGTMIPTNFKIKIY